MLSKKEMSILAALLKYQGSYISSQEIAKAVGLSDRTVRKYLKQLEEVLEQHGALLLSKQSLGTQFLIKDAIAFDTFWIEQKNQHRAVSDVTKLEVADDRERYIINKLFFEGGECSLASLSQELFISKTSISQMLADIREMIAGYNLSLQVEHNHFHVKGKEEDTRHFIKDYFFLDSFNGSIFSLIGDELLEKVHLSEIIHIVIKHSRNAGLQLADFILHNLVLHLALAIKRLKKGHPIQSLSGLENLLNTEEYQVAQSMINDLDATLGIHFPEQEVAYVTVHLRSGRSNFLGSDDSSSSFDSLEEHIGLALRKMGEELALPLEEDGHLINNLKSHFAPLLSRLVNHIQLFNPLTDEIKREYGPVLDLVKEYFTELPELASYEISDDEWVYIALHVLATIEKLSQQQKKRVLVVCATGIGSARMLKNRLEREFSRDIEIEDVVSYFDLAQRDFKDIDLIISSIDLSGLLFLVPVVQVGVLLNQKDIEKIKTSLNNIVIKNHPVDAKSDLASRTEKLDLNLEKIFQADQFLVFDEKLAKKEVLDIMIARLKEAENAGFIEAFHQQLQLRESLSPVVFGEVLAFPHPAKALSIQEQIVVGIFKTPLEWSESAPHVRFVFLISPSMSRNHVLKEVSPKLVDFVENTSLQRKLLENPNFEIFKKLFIPLLRGGGN
jgi:lichenan operon transcriptional antiterminator